MRVLIKNFIQSIVLVEMSICWLKKVLVYINIKKLTEKEVESNLIIFLFLCLAFFIIKININDTIFKSIITTIITTIVPVGATAIVYAAVFSNFILYKLFLVC